MKIKMKNLGTEVKSPSPTVVEKSSASNTKKVVNYPEVTLNSRQIDGLKDVEAGQKCSLTFEAEVKGFRTPESWDLRENGMKETDLIVTFKLVKGNYTTSGGAEKEKGYKNISEASFGARKENKS